MRKLYKLILLSLLSATLSIANAEQTSDATGELALSYQAAFYHYQLKNYGKARNVLLQQQAKGDLDEKSLVLLARVLVDEKNYEQAGQVFALIELDKVPLEVRNRALLALAKMYFSEASCDAALEALEQTKKLGLEQGAYKRFVQTSCAVRNASMNKASLEKVEKALEADIKPGMPVEAFIWFSYAYYNLASAVAEIKEFDWADRLLEEALRYTGAEAEGLALAQRIRLTKAQVRFQDNRFDYALDTYLDIPFDGYWQDEALLGFGWAAFRNFQVSKALEAWWQLTNLPYKSLEVYKAYLLIPFVYEQYNAYTEALRGYDRAVEQFGVLLKELELVKQQITIDRVHQHAVHYYVNPDDLDPIHPLLAKTYTEPAFRLAVEQIGKLTAYQEKLSAYQYALNMHQDYQQEFTAQEQSRRVNQESLLQSVLAQLQALDASLDSWVDVVLAQGLTADTANSRERSAYKRYAQLKKQAARMDESQSLRLKRLQGVLLARAVDYARAAEDSAWLPLLQEVSQRQQRLKVRLAELRAVNVNDVRDEFDGSLVAQKQQQITALLQDVEMVMHTVLEGLTERTQDALRVQHEVISHYEKQARIARANLREEFYQQGGGRLWY